MIPLVDIFAGPGGLSEGFSAVVDRNSNPVFDVALSIEKEIYAHATLHLRTFFRQFHGYAPDEYYRFLRQEISSESLFQAFPEQSTEADARSWHATLGPGGVPCEKVSKRIDAAIGNSSEWVLIGGPPCQAYSVIGRSRNRGIDGYEPAEDIRQHLYVEYLQILADHRPAVFVMENVKGLLSATLKTEHVFQRIVEDLRDPHRALLREQRPTRFKQTCSYRIYSLVEHRQFENGNLEGAVIQAEKYGVPQARHRVILLGVRDDIQAVTPEILTQHPEVTTSQVISSLPRLRSGLSRTEDTAENWVSGMRSQVKSHWANAGAKEAASPELSSRLIELLSHVEAPPDDRGGEFVRADVSSEYRKDWYCDDRLGGVCNHVSKAHMTKDLYRYAYAASYTKLYGFSPTLRKFPKDLLPEHLSVVYALQEHGHFSDRFRVQAADRPSTTVVSHISKDGHYYIHPDPTQCRSLTVREAARLQTFPDNYYFMGPRTAQYVQVGNAVPPLLAEQIGRIVYGVLTQAGVV